MEAKALGKGCKVGSARSSLKQQHGHICAEASPPPPPALCLSGSYNGVSFVMELHLTVLAYILKFVINYLGLKKDSGKENTVHFLKTKDD